MRDATVRVLTSAAAALVVYAVVTAAAPLSVPVRVALAAVAALVAWLVAGRFASSTKSTDRRVASGIRGRNVKVDRVTTTGATIDEVASDIEGTGDVEIKNVDHKDN